MPEERNQVTITGSTVTGSNFAVGDHARAGNQVTGAGAGLDPELLAAALERLAELRGALAERPETVPEADRVAELATELDTDLRAEPADRNRVVNRLTAIALLIGSVAGLTEALTGLMDAVEALYG